MQLKNLGEISTALRSIGKNVSDFNSVASTVQYLSSANTVAVLSSTSLSKAQIELILTKKGLTGAALEQAVATATVSASQNAATAATIGLNTAFKGLGISIANTTKAAIAFLKANPLIALFAGIAVAVGATVKIVDALTTSTKEFTEKAEKSAEELSNLQSEISSINSELTSTSGKIDEILAKDTITIADEEELKKLQLQNEELERQLRIKETLEKHAAKQAAEDASDVLTSYKDITTGNDIFGITSDYMEQIRGLNKEVESLQKMQDKLDPSSSKFKSLQDEIDSITNISIRTNEEDLRHYIDVISKQSGLLTYGISDEMDSIKKLCEDTLDSFYIFDHYVDGKALTIGERLRDKYAHGFNANNASTYMVTSDADKQKASWMESLSDEDKTILVKTTFDENVSLQELKDWLEKANGIVENNKLNPKLSTEQNKLIDDYQSKVSTLSSALKNLRSGKEINMVDLRQEFRELLEGTDNLDTALQDLIYKELKALYESLGADIPEPLKKDLDAIAEFAINADTKIKTLSETMGDLNSASKLLSSIKEEMSSDDFSSLSSSSLKEMVDTYAKMEDTVNSYLAGLIRAEDVYAKLEWCYQNDMNAFQSANQVRMYENEIFYSSAIKDENNRIFELLELYKLDLKEFKNLATAKAAVEETLLGKLAGSWGKYYNTVLGEDGVYKAVAKFNPESYDIQNDPFYWQLEEKAIEMNQFYQDLAASFEIGNLSFDNIRLDNKSGSTPSGSGSSSETSFNWMERRLDLLSGKLETLKKQAEDTFDWSAKNTLTDESISLLEQQIEAYQEAQKQYETQYSKIGLSSDMISKITGGSMDITAYDSKTAKQIQEYQELYDAQQNCVNQTAELKSQIEALNQTKLNNITEAFAGIAEHSKSRSDYAQINIDFKLSVGETVTEQDYEILLQETKYIQEELQKEISQYIQEAESQWNDARQRYRTDSGEYQNAQKQYEDRLSKVNDLNVKLIQEKQNQHDINKAILEIPLRQLERQKDLITDQISSMEKLKSRYSDMIGVVTYYIDRQINALNKSKDTISNTYEGMIQPLKEQIELLQSTNEERERTIHLQKAQYEMERTKNQKNVRLIRDGKFVYESNWKDIQTAQEEYDKVIYDNTIANLNTQIETLEKERDTILSGYDEQIKHLNTISDKWSEIIRDAEMLSKIDLFESTYGSLHHILDGSDTAYDKISNAVETVQHSLDMLHQTKETMEEQMKSVQDYVKAWENGEAELSRIQNQITQTLTEHSSVNTDILKKSEEIMAEYTQMIGQAAEESSAHSFDDLQKNLTAVLQSYDHFTACHKELLTTLPLSAENYHTLAEAAKELNISMDCLQNSVIQFIPEMNALDFVSGSLKESFDAASALMQDISMSSFERMTSALRMLFQSIDLVNHELGIDGIKAMTVYIEQLTIALLTVQNLTIMTESFHLTVSGLKLELTETQLVLQDLDLAMNLASTTLEQIGFMAMNTSAGFHSLADSIYSAANAYYTLASAKRELLSVDESSPSGSQTGPSAYASGTRYSKDEIALIGEVKPELIHHASQGTYEFVTKPSLVKLNQGDRVYSGEETKDILASNTLKLNPALLQQIPIPAFSMPELAIPDFSDFKTRASDANSIHTEKLVLEMPNVTDKKDAEDIGWAITHLMPLVNQQLFRT